MFIKWLREFLNINGIYPDINFVLKMEENGFLSFLDVLVKRKPGTLGHVAYKRSTHFELLEYQI